MFERTTRCPACRTLLPLEMLWATGMVCPHCQHDFEEPDDADEPPEDARERASASSAAASAR